MSILDDIARFAQGCGRFDRRTIVCSRCPSGAGTLMARETEYSAVHSYGSALDRGSRVLRGIAATKNVDLDGNAANGAESQCELERPSDVSRHGREQGHQQVRGRRRSFFPAFRRPRRVHVERHAPAPPAASVQSGSGRRISRSSRSPGTPAPTTSVSRKPRAPELLRLASAATACLGRWRPRSR